MQPSDCSLQPSQFAASGQIEATHQEVLVCAREADTEVHDKLMRFGEGCKGAAGSGQGQRANSLPGALAAAMQLPLL